MLKVTAAVATALFVATSPLAYAQTSTTAQSDHPSAADLKKLTDLRVDLVKAALQMTPDQAKLWPPFENAIRARAENRQARLGKIVETVGKRADEEPYRSLGQSRSDRLYATARGSIGSTICRLE